MQKPENLNIKSERLIGNWDIFSGTFKKASEAYQIDKNNSSSFTISRGMYNFENIVNVLINAWEELYPKFVLNKIESDISSFIFNVQTEVYELISSDAYDYPVVNISYDLEDKFDLFVEPDGNLYPYNEYSKSWFNVELLLDSNQFLFIEIFEQIWIELGIDEQYKFDYLFYLESEKNENEFFIDLFTKHWELAKDRTHSKIFGMLINSEDGIIYSLNDKVFIENSRNGLVEFYNKKGFINK